MSQPNRGNMTLVAQRARAYFSPAIGGTGSPVLLSAEVGGDGVLSYKPPVGWVDLGWVENVKRTPGTRIEPVRAGLNGAVAGQYRTGLEAGIEFDFMQWGKLQMALTACGQPMNILGATSAPVLSSSSATELILQGGAGIFAVGSLIAVDVDYTGQTGLIGSGFAGAYVKRPAVVHSDLNYVRRVTLNVGRVQAVNANSITLEQSLPCGAPPAGARAQQVTAFVDREGGSFFPEWSALLVMESESGGCACFYYPRLQPAASSQERYEELASPLETIALHGTFRALPVTDAVDDEQVLCYRSYYPGADAAVY